MPVTTARVSALLTIGWPNSVWRAYSRSKCSEVLVHGEQGKPGVVGLGDGAAGTVLVDVADREILEIQAGVTARP
jgi:hypothetical protein